jgi:hypothetical protein
MHVNFVAYLPRGQVGGVTHALLELLPEGEI